MPKEELISRFYSGIPIVLLVAAAIIFWGYKMTQPDTPSLITVNQSLPCRFWVILTCSVILICYLLYGYLVSLAWLRLDELGVYGNVGVLSLSERFRFAWDNYLNFVSRFGQLIRNTVGISQNRWEMWITVVPAVVLTPLAMWAVIRPSRLTPHQASTIFSLRGVMFYLAIFSLCLIGSYTKNWFCQSEYAAGCNYLTIHVIFLYILSYFRTDQVNKRNSIWVCLGAFILGLLAGWSTEAITVVMLPLLLAYTAFMAWKHRHILPLRTYSALAGMVCGAYMLFASPALYLRSDKTSSTVSSFVNSMTPDQLQNWLENLTSTEVLKLRGFAYIISLADIPLLDHIYFIPFASERMWECAQNSMIAFIILALLYAATQRQGILKPLLMALGFVGVGWLCSYSYLASCIPQEISYTPSCYMVIVGCAFLLWRLKFKVDTVVVAAIITICAFITILPSAIEAQQYKKYEKARFAYIEQQAAAGVQDIVIKNAVPKKPADKMGLLRVNDITGNPKDYRNAGVAKYHHVKSIRQAPVK